MPFWGSVLATSPVSITGCFCHRSLSPASTPLLMQCALMTAMGYKDSPDEFSVAPVIMKDAECSLVDNLIAEKLILLSSI